jgi:aromatic ring-opening dioxygenase catalytic subunit (LigB family)
MGEIVAAIGTAHAPQFLTRPDSEDPKQLEAVFEALTGLQTRLRALEPDVVIILANDHVENFYLDVVPPFTIFTGTEARGHFAGQDFRYRGQPELAYALLEQGLRLGVDLAYSQNAHLGHSFVVPLHFLLPDPAPPVIPVFVNTYLPPQPWPRRCYDVGKALGEILRQRPERVAVIASGGLSHYPGTDRYPHPDNAFDVELLRMIQAGEMHRLAAFTPMELDQHGNLELLQWLVMLGIMGEEPPCELVTYQPSWHHGYAVVWWDMQAAPRPAERHYVYADPERYPLNTTLYTLMNELPLRQRFLADADAAIADFTLSEEERVAVKNRDVKRLTALGAHPFLAFMADYNLKYET